jgi:predicted amidohydrolase YtcJ
VLVTACSGERAAETGSGQAADLILTNARIYSLSWPDPLPNGQLAKAAPWEQGWFPDASTLAIVGGSIKAVGDGSVVEAWRGDQTQLIDLRGATVIPGLVDSHTHALELGLALNRVSLFDVETEAEAVARIVEKARTVPAGQWIVGQGWDEGAWADRYPDKALLSQAVPDHPVFMRSLHSFAGWGNQMALDRAGLSADSVVPTGGEMRLGPDGKPSGLFLNRAVAMLEDAVPEVNVAQWREHALRGLGQMAVDGYVTVHDAGVTAAQLAALQSLEESGELPLRVYAMFSVRDEDLAREWLQKGPDTDDNAMLVTRSVKAFYDGALGSRGAQLLADYSDMPGHRGVSGDNYGFNQELTAELMRAGFQVGVHAIGDAGNRETLDFFERVQTGSKVAALGRHRIEHAQVLSPTDMPRLGKLAVIASMQPPHMAEDKTWAQDRLGDRIQGAYAWRTMRESGAMLIFGADNPGSDHSIFYGMHAALTRKDKQREPAGGWYPQQALNIDEVVRAYTRWPAFAAFRERQTGTIEPGRWADLTVMDIDPFVLSEADPGAILDGKIVMTIVDGRIVHRTRAVTGEN